MTTPAPTAPGGSSHNGIDLALDRVFWPDHLTSDQQALVDQFRSELQRKNLLHPGQEGTHHSLCRFLQARKWDIPAALHMYANMMEFRRKEGVDSILSTFDFIESKEVFEVYPMFYHGCDRFGRPIYIESMRNVDVVKIFQITTKERFIRAHIQGWERLKQTRFPAASRKCGHEVFTTTCVIDCGGLGMKQFGSTTRDFLKLLAGIDQDNYPEHLGELFLINVPSFFSMVWAFVSKFLDDRTRSKIHVTSAKQMDQVWAVIDPANFPALMGGRCTCRGKGCMYSDLGPWSDPQFAAPPHPPPAAPVPSPLVIPSEPLTNGHSQNGNGYGYGLEGLSPTGASPTHTDYNSPTGSFDELTELDFRAFHLGLSEAARDEGLGKGVREPEENGGEKPRHRPTPSMRLVISDGVDWAAEAGAGAPRTGSVAGEKVVILPLVPGGAETGEGAGPSKRA